MANIDEIMVMLIPVFCTFCAGFAFWIWFNRRNDGGMCAPLPPGSLGLPFIGETLEYLRTQKENRSHEFFDRRVNKYGHNVFTTSLLGHPTVVFYGPDANRFLFANENKLVVNSWPRSVTALFGASSLISTVGDDARRLKSKLMKFLRPDALQKFIGRIDSISCRHLTEHWLGRKQVTVYPLMKSYTFSVACDFFLSLNADADATAKLLGNFMVFLKGVMALPINLPGTRYRKANVAANAIRHQLGEIIKERRIALREGSASPEQDLLSFLMCDVDEDEQGRRSSLTEEEIKDNMLLLLFAGHDTSCSVLTSLLKFLARYPQCYEKVLQEQMEIAESKKEGQHLEWEDLQRMKYTWRVAQETLRLEPPAQGTYRQAITDFTYDGFIIPKGWKIYWTVNSTHCKSEYFRDPEKFDPSRFQGAGPGAYTFVPFGGGPRMCPGNEFTRMEILVWMHNLVKNYRWSMVDPMEKVSVDPMPLPLKGLPIHLFPHH